MSDILRLLAIFLLYEWYKTTCISVPIILPVFIQGNRRQYYITAFIFYCGYLQAFTSLVACKSSVVVLPFDIYRNIEDGNLSYSVKTTSHPT